MKSNPTCLIEEYFANLYASEFSSNNDHVQLDLFGPFVIANDKHHFLSVILDEMKIREAFFSKKAKKA